MAIQTDFIVKTRTFHGKECEDHSVEHHVTICVEDTKNAAYSFTVDSKGSVRELAIHDALRRLEKFAIHFEGLAQAAREICSDQLTTSDEGSS